MSSIRRDFLKLAGGAAVGVAVSPVPWQLLGDSAKWSQNWSWTPKLPRGEIVEKRTACTLCPAGCAVRARCVGTQPVSLWGLGHPLCAAGLCGHHVAFHPARLRTALRRDRSNSGIGTPCAPEAARKAAQAALQRSEIAVLDLHPGRTASLLYRKHAATLNGRYLTAQPSLGPTLTAAAAFTSGATPAFDLDRTDILLSIGTPVLEAWGAPGRMMSPARKFHLWHAGPEQSETATGAERWFRIRPGSEPAFAEGLVAVIDRDTTSVKRCAARCGIATDELSEAAQKLMRARSLAIADPHSILGPPSNIALHAVTVLNVRLGAFGREGGIIGRRDTPSPKDWGKLAIETELDTVPDASLHFLFIDDSTPGAPVPWKRIARKLAPDALVVAASWSGAGIARNASFTLPAISYLEGWNDIAVSPDVATARFALSLPLVDAPAGAVEPVEWVGRLAGDSITLADRLKERAAAIHASGRGTLSTAGDESIPLKGIETPAKMWEALAAGGRWTDDPRPEPMHATNLPNTPLGFSMDWPGLVVVPSVWFGADVSPMMTKLWVESDLKPRTEMAYLHPETAREYNIEDGARARIVTGCGECEVKVQFADSVQPGTLAMVAGTAWMSLCDLRDGAWRAEVRKLVRI